MGNDIKHSKDIGGRKSGTLWFMVGALNPWQTGQVRPIWERNCMEANSKLGSLIFLSL